MREARKRRALGAGWLLWLVLPAAASAESPPLGARLTCEPAAAIGRVRCDVEVSPPTGARVGWADALVVESPEFARPLRSRVRAVREAGRGPARAPLALVATRIGQGTLRVRARAVLCADTDALAPCRAAMVDLDVELRVGPG